VDDDPEFQDILSRALSSGQTYAAELQLGPTEVHAEDRIVDFRVSSLENADLTADLLIEMSDVTRRSRISRENALLIQHGAGRQMIRQGGKSSNKGAFREWTQSPAHWAEQQLNDQDRSPLLDTALPEFERTLIRIALNQAKGHRQDAAKLLGWGRQYPNAEDQEPRVELKIARQDELLLVAIDSP